MFSVYLSYKYYLIEIFCRACLGIQSSLGILPHSLRLRVKYRLLKLAGLAQLRWSNLNLWDTMKAKRSLKNLAQSRDLLRQVFGRVNTRYRHHQLLKQDRLALVGDALPANVGIGGQRRRLQIRDGPSTLNRVNSFVTGGRTLSSSPLLCKRRRKLLSSCFSNFAEAATSTSRSL